MTSISADLTGPRGTSSLVPGSACPPGPTHRMGWSPWPNDSPSPPCRTAIAPSRRRSSGLPFQRLISAEDFQHYKPDPEVYQGAAAVLGLEPDQVMMVAAHKPDLQAARSAGLRTAFVERPLEKGPSGRADLLPDPESDVQATDFGDLATQLARPASGSRIK
jgi:hypothetical protein